MERKIVMFSLFLLLSIMLLFFNLKSQEVAPPLNSEPLERLEYLAIIDTGNGEILMKKIQDIVEKNEFTIEKIDLREALIKAERAAKKKQEGYDRVVIWLERDFQEPSRFIKIFFLGGKFLEIVGATSGIRRVYYGPGEEETRLGKLKREIMNIKIS